MGIILGWLAFPLAVFCGVMSVRTGTDRWNWVFTVYGGAVGTVMGWLIAKRLSKR